VSEKGKNMKHNLKPMIMLLTECYKKKNTGFLLFTLKIAGTNIVEIILTENSSPPVFTLSPKEYRHFQDLISEIITSVKEINYGTLNILVYVVCSVDKNKKVTGIPVYWMISKEKSLKFKIN
jgi:hypothetical protein